jgi:hypothetical protein
VCTCEFLLHRESFNVMLYDTHISMIGVLLWYQSCVEVKCALTKLKNDQQCFTVRNVFCPHKDYSSFLGDKLTMFKLYNYGKGNGVIFCIVLNYFVVYEAYFVVGEI